jgi:hypothetical protein
VAAFAITNGFLSVASNDLSTYVRSMELQVNGETVDVTAMSSTSWRAMVAGLRSWSVVVTINTDVAAGLADSILWPLYQTSVAVEVRATGSAVSTSNPKWTGSGILQPGTVFGGSVGDASTTTFTIVGSGALTRATA